VTAEFSIDFESAHPTYSPTLYDTFAYLTSAVDNNPEPSTNPNSFFSVAVQDCDFMC